jgi:hypothetical protein
LLDYTTVLYYIRGVAKLTECWNCLCMTVFWSLRVADKRRLNGIGVQVWPFSQGDFSFCI